MTNITFSDKCYILVVNVTNFSSGDYIFLLLENFFNPIARKSKTVMQQKNVLFATEKRTSSPKCNIRHCF